LSEITTYRAVEAALQYILQLLEGKETLLLGNCQKDKAARRLPKDKSVAIGCGGHEIGLTIANGPSIQCARINPGNKMG